MNNKSELQVDSDDGSDSLQDDPDISNDEILFRGIPTEQWTSCGNADHTAERPSSSAFKTEYMSVVIQSGLTELGLTLDDLEDNISFKGRGIAEFTAGYARELGLCVCYQSDPDDPNEPPSHGLVFRSDYKKMRKEGAKISKNCKVTKPKPE